MVASARWFKNAFRRTLLAFAPAKARADDAFAQGILSAEEYKLYLKMDVRDRCHACLVAKTLSAEKPDASLELLRAALLHDVGKSGISYSAWQRIAVHLYTPRDLPLQPRLKGMRGIWQINLHHGIYGAQMIRQAGGSERVAEIIERHHKPHRDGEAALLKTIDERF